MSLKKAKKKPGKDVVASENDPSKKMKKAADKDVVYDDDSSDSDIDDQDLRSFHAKINRADENGQDDDDESSDEEGQESASSEEDESGTESTADESEEKKELTLKKAHFNAKLSGLKDQLSALKKDSKASPDSSSIDEESSEEEEDAAADKEEAESSLQSPKKDSQKPVLSAGQKRTKTAEEKVKAEKSVVVATKKSKSSLNEEEEEEGVSSEGSDDSEEEESDEQDEEEEDDLTDEQAQRDEFRRQLGKMSLEEIQKMKEQMGLKLFNRQMGAGPKAAGGKEAAAARKRRLLEFKRENKNRPRETSSKKTVKRLRDVVGLKADQKVEKRDPRFDNLCGDFDEKIFKDSYKFVDAIKAKELASLKSQLKEEDDPETVTKLKYLIQRAENQAREKAKVEKRKTLDKEQRARNKELAAEGKKPVFMGKRERQNIELVDKFEELKKSGKLEQYIRKKNKKNLAKDRKRLKGTLA